jgi:hypothetical protein
MQKRRADAGGTIAVFLLYMLVSVSAVAQVRAAQSKARLSAN